MLLFYQFEVEIEWKENSRFGECKPRADI